MSNKLAVMQAYFFPYIGYFQLINAVDYFVIYENVNFRKGSWMTRNRLLELNKGEFYFKVPVLSASSFKKTSEIKLDNSTDWRGGIKRFLELNYKQRPFYEQVHAQICGIIDTPSDSLHTYNALTIAAICEMLSIKTAISWDNTKYLALEEKLKDNIADKITEPDKSPETIPVKAARILALCRDYNSDIYINAIGGKQFYPVDTFKSYNVIICFLRTKEFTYPQGRPDFCEHLSIIDVLYSLGTEGTKILLSQYDLV